MGGDLTPRITMTDRTVLSELDSKVRRKKLAQIAMLYAENGMDHYSGYGVGAAIQFAWGLSDVSEYTIYGGTNINIPGMEYKLHAEQSCLFQFLTDLSVSGIDPERKNNCEIVNVVVSTSEKDHSLVCGHCIQVVRSVADFLGQDPGKIEYVAAKPTTEGNYSYRENRLGELLGSTYVENRGVNEGEE